MIDDGLFLAFGDVERCHVDAAVVVVIEPERFAEEVDAVDVVCHGDVGGVAAVEGVVAVGRRVAEVFAGDEVEVCGVFVGEEGGLVWKIV